MVKRHLYLQWDSTEDCNLSCKHCYHKTEGNSEHIQKRKIMTLEEACLMVDDLKETSDRWEMIPDLGLSGGEPMKRDDLFGFLEYTKKKNVHIKFMTNGTLITLEKAKKLKEVGVHDVQISIDGNRKVHNKIRGASFAYDLAMEGIRNSTEAGITVNVAITLMQQNKEYFQEIIEESMKAGAKKVGFKSYVPDPKLGDKDPNYLNSAEFYEMVLLTKMFEKEYSGRIKVLSSDVLFQVLQSEDNPLIQRAKLEGKFLTGCSAGYRALSVLSDGVVYPCRRLPIEIGHISDGIRNIFLNSKVMKNLRNMDQMRKNANCNKVTHCRGCRAIAYAVTGDYMQRDPMCYKDLIRGENGKS